MGESLLVHRTASQLLASNSFLPGPKGEHGTPILALLMSGMFRKAR